MNTRQITLTTEEIQIIRDCISEETVRMRLFIKETAQPSTRAKRRYAVLEELLRDFKNECM